MDMILQGVLQSFLFCPGSTFFSCVFAFLPWYVFGKSRKTCVSMRVICVSCRSVRGAKTAPLSQRGAKTAPLWNVSGAFGTPPMRVISCRFWLILKTCQDSTLRHPGYNGVKQFTVGDMGKRKAWGLVNTHTNLTFCLEKHVLGKQRANVFGKALDSCGTIVKKIPWVWDWKSCFSGAPSSWMLRGVETAPLKKLNFWNWNGTPLNLLVYIYIYRSCSWYLLHDPDLSGSVAMLRWFHRNCHQDTEH